MEKYNVTSTDYQKSEEGNEAVASTIEELSPEKQTRLAYLLNIQGEDLNTLTSTLEWYKQENDTAAIEFVSGLIAAYGDASTPDAEKQIVKQIVTKL